MVNVMMTMFEESVSKAKSDVLENTLIAVGSKNRTTT
jgi:hypothetical protein